MARNQRYSGSISSNFDPLRADLRPEALAIPPALNALANGKYEKISLAGSGALYYIASPPRARVICHSGQRSTSAR